jgi:hypothetical protein
MMRPMAFGGISALLLFLAAPARPEPPPVPLLPDGRPAEFYSCAFREPVAGGELRVGAELALDGRMRGYYAEWLKSERDPYMRIRIDWEGPTFAATAAGPRIEFQVDAERDFAGRAELRRAGNDNAPPLFAGATNFGLMKYVVLPWRRIDAAARGSGGILVVTRRLDGRFLSRTRFDAATFDAAATALAANRARLEAMVADYRNRCDPAVVENISVSAGTR